MPIILRNALDPRSEDFEDPHNWMLQYMLWRGAQHDLKEETNQEDKDEGTSTTVPTYKSYNTKERLSLEGVSQGQQESLEQNTIRTVEVDNIKSVGEDRSTGGDDDNDNIKFDEEHKESFLRMREETMIAEGWLE